MSGQQFRVFFDGQECVPASGDTKVTIAGDNELPEDTMGVSVKLDSEADRTLRSKLQTVERARIKQERPPIDFDGYVVILDRSWSEVTHAAHYTLVPVKLPPSLCITGRIDVPPHLQAEPPPLPDDYVDLDIKLNDNPITYDMEQKPFGPTFGVVPLPQTEEQKARGALPGLRISMCIPQHMSESELRERLQERIGELLDLPTKVDVVVDEPIPFTLTPESPDTPDTGSSV
jgi:hypothetical protein